MSNKAAKVDEWLYERFGNYIERHDTEIRLARMAEVHQRALANPHSRLILMLPRATWRTHDADQNQRQDLQVSR